VTEGFDPLTQQQASLFHPRKQVWSEHFGLQRASCRINGENSDRAGHN
jgi:hypothetical protein